MVIREVKTIVKEYSSISELENEDKMLVEKSKESVKNAYAPYSSFNVGAAVLLENGEIFTGNNQENAVYPSGLCAERVTLFYANAQYPDIPVKAIAVCAYLDSKFIKAPVPPCGSCRQVLSEAESRFNKPIKIILYGESKIYIIDSVSELLPITFDKSFLDK